MKTLFLILASSTVLMFIFTLICGLWIRSQSEVEPSSVNFHMGMALLTMILTLATIVVSVREIA